MDNEPTILIIDDSKPSMRAILDALAEAESRVFDVLAIQPELMREPPMVPTAERILREQHAALPTLHGIQVRVSQALEGLRMPVRQHKRRRWMSDAYHQRIQKKWNKRFGTAPAAVLMNTAYLRSTDRGTDHG